MTSLKQSKEQPNVADIFEYKVSNGYRTVLSLYPLHQVRNVCCLAYVYEWKIYKASNPATC